STSHIVDLMNAAIKDMKLPSLAAVNGGKKEMRLLKFENEQAENEFSMQRVENSGEKVFILARTNKQLSALSESMRKRNISHSIRNEFDSGNEEGRVTLSTIHAIKGMEADTVFLIGCTNSNFPCRGSEHPIIEMLEENDYDREEEEKRIFYVAISRPRAALYLTFSGKGISPFINDGMKEILDEKKSMPEANAESAGPLLSKGAARAKPKQGSLFEKLKSWRYQASREDGIPPYMIMHDRTLLELCERMPINKEELSEIRGIGPAKIRRYGSEILNVLHTFK
ncbi:exodeoxyribonuclease V subunit gamma, partial [Candidatus Woesearchaeota archaeon]|nr:exodeoxyribonuclease V subunit gamma [Candidatus Woesearchaeota archaeon]